MRDKSERNKKRTNTKRTNTKKTNTKWINVKWIAVKWMNWRDKLTFISFFLSSHFFFYFIISFISLFLSSHLFSHIIFFKITVTDQSNKIISTWIQKKIVTHSQLCSKLSLRVSIARISLMMMQSSYSAIIMIARWNLIV